MKRRAARLAAARQAAEAKRRAAARRRVRARQISATPASRSYPAGTAGADNSVSLVVLLGAAAALWAVLIVGLGAVSRSRMSDVIEEHHVHFALVGGMILLSVAILFALTLAAR